MKNTNTLAQRFTAFRLAALAASAVVSVETSPAPRAPVMPKIWVAKKPAPVASDPLDEPLPADFVAQPFIPYVSTILTLDPETEAEIARESEKEIAETFARIDRELAEEQAARAARWAVRFVSDLSPQGIDYSPDGTHGKPVHRAPIAPRVHNRRLSDAGFAAFASNMLAQACA